MLEIYALFLSDILHLSPYCPKKSGNALIWPHDCEGEMRSSEKQTIEIKFPFVSSAVWTFLLHLRHTDTSERSSEALKIQSSCVSRSPAGRCAASVAPSLTPTDLRADSLICEMI